MILGLLMLLFFSASTSNSILSRKISGSTKLPYFLIPCLGYGLVVAPLGILACIFMGDYSIVWSVKLALALLAQATFIGIFNVLIFKAFQHLGAGPGSVLMQVFTLVSILGGWILLGEKLTFGQLSSILILLIGVVIVGLAAKNNTAVTLKPVITMLAAGSSLGLGLVFEKYALDQMSIGMYFMIGFTLQFLALIVINILTKTKVPKLSKQDLKYPALIGLTSVATGFAYIGSVRIADNVGLISSISAFQLPTTVLAGYLILHEKENLKQVLIGTAIATTGLIALTIS